MVIITPTTKGRIIGFYTHPENPKQATEIGRLVGKPKSSCQSVIKHWKEHGHVHTLPRPGRPPKLDLAGKQRLIRAMDRDPWSTSDVFGPIVGISGRQVQRIAHKHGLHSRIAREKPFVSTTNHQKRLAWVKDNEGWDFRKNMFTDESIFKVGETGRRRVWRRAGHAYKSKYVATKFRHGKTVHVWGAILYGVKLPLIRFKLAKARQVKKVKIAKETVTSAVYADQVLWGPLQDYVNQARAMGVDVHVVEDGASVHFKGVAARVREMQDIPNRPHPPSSPDLNPIEDCWGMIKAKLRRMGRRLTSEDGSWIAIQQAWEEIDVEKINRRIDTMEERRLAVLEAKGGPTSF